MPGMGSMGQTGAVDPMQVQSLGNVMQGGQSMGGSLPPEALQYLRERGVGRATQSRPAPTRRMPEYDIPPEVMDRARTAAPMPEYTMPDGFQPAPMPMVEPDPSFMDRPRGASAQPSYEEMMRAVIERFGSVENAQRIFNQMNAPR